MPVSGLSFSSRKALCVQLGETAGTEIADVLKDLTEQIEHLQRNKVDKTPVTPISQPQPADPAERRAG